MFDFIVILLLFSSIKIVIDIVQLFKYSYVFLEKVEYKLCLVELVSVLVDVRIELVWVQEMLVEKDQQIGTWRVKVVNYEPKCQGEQREQT